MEKTWKYTAFFKHYWQRSLQKIKQHFSHFDIMLDTTVCFSCYIIFHNRFTPSKNVGRLAGLFRRYKNAKKCYNKNRNLYKKQYDDGDSIKSLKYLLPWRSLGLSIVIRKGKKNFLMKKFLFFSLSVFYDYV